MFLVIGNEYNSTKASECNYRQSNKRCNYLKLAWQEVIVLFIIEYKLFLVFAIFSGLIIIISLFITISCTTIILLKRATFIDNINIRLQTSYSFDFDQSLALNFFLNFNTVNSSANHGP